MDRERITQLVTQRAAALALYARQWLDAAAAEDAVQEALIALLARTEAPEDALAWMYRVVRNSAIDGVRAASRRQRREEAVATTRSEWFESGADSLIDARAGEDALQTLAHEQREIVVMRIWGDLSFQQIAHVLNLGVATVHDRYAAALKQMRIRLEKPCPKKTK